jgi:hypothetical protein
MAASVDMLGKKVEALQTHIDELKPHASEDPLS